MKKILIVEDEKDLVKLLKIRLERAGYEVFAAHDGREGLNLCLEIKPDLIITDVLMPQMTGYEMVRQIRAKGGDLSKIAIIVITAKGSMKDFFDQFDHILFTQKPFDQQKLLEMVDESVKNLSEGLSSKASSVPSFSDSKKISSASKKIMLLGVDEYLLEKLKNFLVDSGHQVFPIYDEKDACSKVSQIRPDAFLIQYFEDPLTLDAVKVYNLFSKMPETKNLPFVTFCMKGLDIDAYQLMKAANIIPYSESADLLKSIEKFIKEKL